MSSPESPTRRRAVLNARPVYRDRLAVENADLGLVAMDGPHDPAPSLRIRDGVVEEMDGRPREQFDLIDRFIADHGLDLAVAEAAMRLPDQRLARMLVDINVPRADLVRLASGLTPAKLARVAALLSPVEAMFAARKMRARAVPSAQAHVTNRVDHPLLLAADAAMAVATGFREIETTVPVLADAPINAIALLVGSQVPAAGALTQCSVEESVELTLGMRGLTSYAETVSLYGTEPVFIDGDDTPWSKALLVSAYASRGMKLRVTSGAGSECLMGAADGKSLLYLEARCIVLARAIGSQGVQNGGIDGISVAGAVPGGMHEIFLENLLVMWLGLEACTGNDTLMSASDIRRTAHTLPTLLAGSDLLFSGYGAVPAYDNSFGPSNFNIDDLPDYLVVQRDWMLDAALHEPDENELTGHRRTAAIAVRDVLDALELITLDDRHVDAAVDAHGSQDMPEIQSGQIARAGRLVLDKGYTVANVARALSQRGHHDLAVRVVAMAQLRGDGDHLHIGALVNPDLTIDCAFTAPNTYDGPTPQWRPGRERRAQITNLRHVEDVTAIPDRFTDHGPPWTTLGPAARSDDPRDVVIALSPAAGERIFTTLSGLSLRDVVTAIGHELASAGLRPRLVRVHRSIDLGRIAADGSALAGSGWSLALQGKGTAMVHHHGRPPLAGEELLSVAPRLRLHDYTQLAANLAGYLHDRPVDPVLIDPNGEPLGPPHHLDVVALVHVERTAQQERPPTEVTVR